MKKLLFIFICGILLLGGVSSAILYSTDNFVPLKDAVTLSASTFYTKLISLNKLSSKEIPKEIPTFTKEDFDRANLEITKNKEGVIKINSK